MSMNYLKDRTNPSHGVYGWYISYNQRNRDRRLKSS